MNRGIIIILTILCIAPVLSFAQNKVTVSGMVTDEDNQAVIGCNVIVKGATIGAITDLNGHYSITVPSDALLEFSCVGMLTTIEAVKGRTSINVCLKADNTFLESIVVVGYGTQKKGSVTGAVSGIDSKELIRTKTENPQNMLTGRIPGIRVWQKSAEPGTYHANMLQANRKVHASAVFPISQ